MSFEIVTSLPPWTKVFKVWFLYDDSPTFLQLQECHMFFIPMVFYMVHLHLVLAFDLAFEIRVFWLANNIWLGSKKID